MSVTSIVTAGYLLLLVSSVSVAFKIIFPGTKWCGNGDIAKNDKDLGRFKDSDKCCEDHDHCRRKVFAGTTKWNITNDGRYPWSDCKCDEAFKQCLLDVDSRPADMIGEVYFGVFKDYPCIHFEDDGSVHRQPKPKYKSLWTALKDVFFR